jgi:tetratricopeptide (TPR) repeat protein
MASGHPDEALRDIDRAIQLQPDFPQAYSNRGNVFLREGRVHLAIHDFYRAGKIPMVCPESHRVLTSASLVVMTTRRSRSRRPVQRRKRKYERSLCNCAGTMWSGPPTTVP